MARSYRYRPDILARIHSHSLFPRPHTPPVVVRDFLKALYTMEIRTMRVAQQRQERAGDSSGRQDYARRVVETRDRYDILTIPVEWWAEVE